MRVVSGAVHADGRRPERSHQAAFPMAVAGAGSPLRRSCAALASPFIAVAPGRVQSASSSSHQPRIRPRTPFPGDRTSHRKENVLLGGMTAVFVLSVYGVISVACQRQFCRFHKLENMPPSNFNHSRYATSFLCPDGFPTLQHRCRDRHQTVITILLSTQTPYQLTDLKLPDWLREGGRRTR